ncbi:ribosome-binding protein 1 isoform X2 [Tribolium madens]|uniref:ribosome-binding protein 1 isoform X2 n=1 Tax=Tribolium madens TaxID=41895 RepID=UPI001CF72B24|nr:ribosome-binding protein 1 isoform X2 [Tribolium madens]
MDFQIPFVFVSLFSLASVLLIFVYKFGIKEKSYEEALAEQRQQNHILLGAKPKLKEKKNKKTSKKVKEKINLGENETVEEPESETNQKNMENQKKLHVEFKEVTEEVSVKPPSPPAKKQSKKEKVRPILVKKDKLENDVETVADEVPTQTNHFEELHPKDDFELKFHSISVEETPNPDKNVENNSHKKQPETETTPLYKENHPQAVTSSINGFISNTGKEKKKKKSEFNTLQQLGDSNGPNLSLLLNLVRKAELSRSEVQILIDLLLNKQHEAPAVLDEWTEGKTDPVQKLKKQLAEKEKLLQEEQQIATSAQAKLREIRNEQQAEKSRLQQKIRNMEEIDQKKQLEAGRLHQQVQQLQAQLKDEVLKSHKLREEHAAIQIQRQQIEIRLNQAQESEVIINRLQTEVQEMGALNNQLRMELTRITEENLVEKERSQSFILQLSNFQKELEQKTDRNRQLEETRLKLERDLDAILKQDNEYKAEISRLSSVLQQQNEEIRRMEHGKKQHLDELQKQKDETNKIKNDLRKAQEETAQLQMSHMNGSLQENKQHEVEILNLHNELTSVKTKLHEVEKQSENELKVSNEIAEKLQKKVDELQLKCQEEKTKLEEQKMKNNQTKSEKDVQREFIQRLFPEIQDEKIMNANAFESDGEKFIRSYINDLKKQSSKENEPDASQLKLQLKHYKDVIDNTEKMLNKLQKHIEQEEINWRMQLSAKTAELEQLKENCGSELQERLTSLELELKKEREDKKRIIAQFNDKTDLRENSSNGLHLR